MTISELSRYHNTKIEIRQLEESIKELEETIISSSKIMDNSIVVNSSENSSPTERIGIKLVQLTDKLTIKKEVLLDEAHKIEDFLSTVDVEEIRIIIRERFLNGKTWEEISKIIITDRSTPYYRLKNYLNRRIKDEEIKR